MDGMARWLGRLGEVLVRLGLPEEYRVTGALILIYLLVTAALAAGIFLFLRSRRRAPSAPPKEGEEAVPPSRAESASEAVAEEKTAAGEEIARAPEKAPVPPPAPAISLFDRMRAGLAKTQSSLVGRIDTLLRARNKVDAELMEELEEILVSADLGMKTTQELIRGLETRLSRSEEATPEGLRQMLKEEIRERLRLEAAPLQAASAPFVIMVVGVNGVGKTTTIGKLAWQFTQAGKKVVLAAGDTFRAAAAEQLAIWGERSGAEVIRHADGADPAAVAYDAIKAALARQADILILDTAGRLHTKVNLMEELKKVRRVLGRELPGAPHETLLVLDATTGQNALVQARLFRETVEVTGIALTKLDGTARGGIIVAIGSELGLPVRYVGIGEAVEDLRPFDPDLFLEALFESA